MKTAKLRIVVYFKCVQHSEVESLNLMSVPKKRSKVNFKLKAFCTTIVVHINNFIRNSEKHHNTNGLNFPLEG